MSLAVTLSYHFGCQLPKTSHETEAPYTVNIWREKLMNHELFAKFFLANIHTKNVFGICTECSLFTKFPLPIAFTYVYGLPKFPPPNISRVW